MNKATKRTGFTLVEVIVAITILAILGTIGFVSYSGYLKSARDSVRKTDVKNIHKVLDLYKAYNDTYPEPSDYYEVVYNGFPLWKQGSYGKKTQAITGKLFGDLEDPKFGNNYPYSVSSSGKEYQVGVVYEKNEVKYQTQNLAFDSIVPETYAGSPIADYNPKDLFSNTGALRFWYDGKDVDADENPDVIDPSIENVGIVENVQSVDFSPFYFDRVIWLDAQNINGGQDQPDDGEDITEWKNRTGEGNDGFVPQTGNNHGSPAYSTPPSYSDTGFGLQPGVFFDGAPKGNRIVVDRGGKPRGKGFSLAYTFKINDTSNTSSATIISVGPTGGGAMHNTTGSWQLSRDGYGNNFIFRISGSITGREYFNNASCISCGSDGVYGEVAFGSWNEVNNDEPHTVFVTYEGNTVSGYLDGTKRFEATMSSATKPYGEYFRLFGNRAGSAYLKGMLGEVFIADDRLSLQDLQKIEAYFSERWAWEEGLPDDHPYKDDFPKMDAFSQLQYNRYAGPGNAMNDYNREAFFASNPELLTSKIVRFPGSMPDINIEEDNKVHIWRGPIKVSETGYYDFTLNADDYAFLQINGENVVDAGADTSGEQNGTIYLVADADADADTNTVYDFELVYGEHNGSALFDYRVDGPGVVGYRKYEAFGWKDRSDFSRDLTQVTPELQPDYNPTTSSFTISPSSYFNFPSAPYQNDENFEIFIVWKLDNTENSEGESYVLENSTVGNGFVGLGGNGMKTGSETAVGTNILGKNTTLSSYQLDNIGNTQKYFISGQNYQQNITDISGYNGSFVLGSKSLGFTGSVMEVVGFAANLSQEERETIEGYLSHKWGIANKLNVLHPYYQPPETGEQTFVEVRGNYNGIFSHGSLGDTHVVVASPSIMSSYVSDPGTTVDISTIIGENKLAYNGFKNVPASYAAVDEVVKTLTTKNGFYFDSPNPLLFQGPKNQLASYIGISEVDLNVRKIYETSHIYPYIAYYLDDENSNYAKKILSNIIGINPITPYYCKDILEKSLGINIGIGASVIGSSGTDESDGLVALHDNVTIYPGQDYGYITNEGDDPRIIFNFDEPQPINLIRIHNSFGTLSKNLWEGALEIFNENDELVYTYTFGDTEGVSTIEIHVDLDESLSLPTKMTIRPSTDFSRIALREIEVYAGDNIVSGVYKVDADGAGGKTAYQVYCDMITDGGGWTRIGENYIDSPIFREQKHPSAYTLSNSSENTLRTNIALPSSIQEGNVLKQTGDENVKYELEFSNIPNVEFTSEIRLGAWVKNSSNSIFSYAIDYVSGSDSGVAEAKLLRVQGTWKYYETRIPLTDKVDNFTWNLGEGVIGTNSSGIYVTGISMEIYYK